MCNDLAFYTTDPDQIDRLFRQSGLMRDKWDEKHFSDGRTYGQATIQKALADTQNHYNGKLTESLKPINGDYVGPLNWDGTPEDDGKKRLKIVSLEDIEAQRADYLIYPYFPRGKLTIVGGVSGSTKTWFVLSVAAILSNGGLFISEDPHFVKRQPGISIYQTKENDYNTDIRPRLDKLGADVSKIVMIDERNADGMGDSLSLSDNRIAEACEILHPYMIVFDPIQSYLGANVDMHKANEVRPILDNLIDIAKRYNCAVVLISHMSKMTTASALDRLLGSSDFRNAARSILIVGSDPQDKNSRIVAHAKNSLGVCGQSIRYHIDENSGVVYDGFCELTDDEIVQPVRTGQRGRPADAIGEAITQLEMLFDGRDAVPYDEIQTLQTLGCFSKRTMYGARRQLELKSAAIGQPPDRKSWWVRPHVNVNSFLAEKKKELEDSC